MTRRAFANAVIAEVHGRGVGGGLSLAAEIRHPLRDIYSAMAGRQLPLDRVAACLGYEPHPTMPEHYRRIPEARQA